MTDPVPHDKVEEKVLRIATAHVERIRDYALVDSFTIAREELYELVDLVREETI